MSMPVRMSEMLPPMQAPSAKRPCVTRPTVTMDPSLRSTDVCTSPAATLLRDRAEPDFPCCQNKYTPTHQQREGERGREKVTKERERVKEKSGEERKGVGVGERDGGIEKEKEKKREQCSTRRGGFSEPERLDGRM